MKKVKKTCTKGLLGHFLGPFCPNPHFRPRPEKHEKLKFAQKSRFYTCQGSPVIIQFIFHIF